MKKLICLTLALMLALASVPALAAGRLNVVQENFHAVSGWWNYGYAFAKVENSGDKPIKVNAGVMEIYNAAGEVLTSTDWMSSYATYLQPGEYTYVQMYSELEEGMVAADYMLTLTGKSDSSMTALRLPVSEVRLSLNEEEGWLTYNYMYATVTNNTDAPLYSIEVVLALLDEEGNILYVDSKELYSEVALMPGSSMIVRRDISSSFLEYYAANGLTPATVDAIAYVLAENE